MTYAHARKPASRLLRAPLSSASKGPVTTPVRVQEILHGARYQPNLTVGPPDDAYEREADRVADAVMRMPVAEGSVADAGAPPRIQRLFSDCEGETKVQRACSHCEDQMHRKAEGKGEEIEIQRKEYLPGVPDGASFELALPRGQIQPGSSFGQPLEAGARDEMGRKIGADFSNVRVHSDEAAIHLSRSLNARAFTYGSDIFFNKGEYNPASQAGKRLLAHELTHVVQQAGTGDGVQRKMIQRTRIGQILNEFFSPFSAETLWIMSPSDSYTGLVRTWQPVIDAVVQVKALLAANCAAWAASHRTDPTWTAGMTDPPVTDPNASPLWISSPPGTDPVTCRDAFIIYVATRAHPYVPTVETFELSTCSIGSFGIYATVNSIDCAARTATMNIWMYNAMDRGSFGRYASHPAFALSGMERQYMWWNWTEPCSWGSAPAPGGGSGGSSGW